MNRYLAIGVLGFGLMVSPLFAKLATSGVPAPKIGVIDLDNTLSTTPAGKRANEAFEKTRKTKQNELDKQQQDLKAAAADLDKQKAVLKPEAYAAKKAELEKKFVDLQQVYVRLERDLAGEHDPERRRCRGFEQPAAGDDRDGVGRVCEAQHVPRIHAREHRHALQCEHLFNRGQALVGECLEVAARRRR